MNLHPIEIIEPGDIIRDTLAEPVSGLAGRYATTIPEAWRVFYAFGGMTMALALRTAERALGRDDLHMVSAQATYCQAVPCGPVALEAEVIRNGRKAAQVEVRLWSTDDPTGPRGADLIVAVVFGAEDPASPYRLIGATFPEDAADPDDLPVREDAGADNPFAQIPYHRQTEWRLAVGHAPWDPELREGSDPRTVSWFRFNTPPLRPDGSWEPSSIAVPGDVLGPAVLEGVGRSGDFFLVITLQLSLQFFAPMRGRYLCQHTRAQHAGGGFATGTAELWSEDRTLVAMATQAALLQPMVRG